MSQAYNAEVEAHQFEAAHPPDRDPKRISWNRNLDRDFERYKLLPVGEVAITAAGYRPFFRQHVHFSRRMNAMTYRLPTFFPAPSRSNVGLVVMAPRPEAQPAALAVQHLPDLAFYTYAAQFYGRWRYEALDPDALQLDDSADAHDGYRKVDNITDAALARFRAAYGMVLSKDDVFFYVYGLLHSPEYRETYAADLKKMLPRIPLVEDAQPFVDAGRALSALHLDYEAQTPYPLDGLDVAGPGGEADYDFFHAEKMRFGKPTPKQKAAGQRSDRTTIVYNSHITLSGIPEAAYRYMLGSRSAIEWIVDRYQVKQDKSSGIVNDPNDWSREVGDPRYVVDLLARIVTVSLKTMNLVDALPSLAIRADQGAGTS